MSDPSSSPHATPSKAKLLYSALAWVGVILLFGLIVAVAYLPNQAPPVNQADIDQRLQIRAETEAAQQKLATTYQVVNAAEGQVRIPLNQAMELTVAELAAANEAKLAGNAE